MVLVVLGIDALDPDLIDPGKHPNLTLERNKCIETIDSSAGEPSTHELWPTIITGLRPEEHGLTLDDGVAWENSLLRYGSAVADWAVPDGLQTAIGAWLLNNTEADAFRVPATYYDEEGIETLFDGRSATAIGVPNFVTEPNREDREHNLRRSMGDLFERDPDATGGHRSADVVEFYETCLEMIMVRVARARAAVQSGGHELVFAYTSGLDLIGHVTYDRPEIQMRAYGDVDAAVGDLLDDLGPDDELLLVSDHGLQDGVHTHEAMIAGTRPETVDGVESVLDVRGAVEAELDRTHHERPRAVDAGPSTGDGDRVEEHLESLGYI